MLPSCGPFWETTAGQRWSDLDSSSCFQSSCSSCGLDTAVLSSPILPLGPRLPEPLWTQPSFQLGVGVTVSTGWSPRASVSALLQSYDHALRKSLRPCWDLGEAGGCP